MACSVDVGRGPDMTRSQPTGWDHERRLHADRPERNMCARERQRREQIDAFTALRRGRAASDRVNSRPIRRSDAPYNLMLSVVRCTLAIELA